MEGLAALHALERCAKEMRHVSILAFLLLSGCADSVVERFRDCCSHHREHAFEKELSELVPIGVSTEKIDELLAVADKRIQLDERTDYIFSYATGVFSEQGLVITISVNDASGTITAVRSAVAAN